MKRYDVILFGAGCRGKIYTDEMIKLPSQFRIVAVAEPIKERRDYVKEKFNIPDEMCFETWEDVVKLPKFADLVINATMDQMHYESTIPVIKLGYDVLLEKPISNDVNECARIAMCAKEHGVKIMVCHVLRYCSYYYALKEYLKLGKLGKIMSISHIEEVGNLHQSHSFVRGNWGNSDRTSPMILQKSCHDMDLLQWLVGKKVKNVQSFGSLTYFTEENAPEGAPDYCIDGCPHADTCYYNAVKLYYDDKENSWFRGMAAQTPDNPPDELVEKALHDTQYGKCVYKCDNNVVDHQTVNLEFEDGTTAVFTMCAFNKGGRRTEIMGTDGHLICDMERNITTFFDFKTREFEDIKLIESTTKGDITGGHGRGDTGIVEALYEYLEGKLSADEVSEIGISCQNHLIAFAAEEARVTSKVISFDEYEERMMK